ncbi:MAG: PF20097 family protein [Tissierellaceae bacterium]
MKCPYCSEEMKLGFINGDRYSLKWISAEKDRGPLFQWFTKRIKLSKDKK